MGSFARKLQCPIPGAPAKGSETLMPSEVGVTQGRGLLSVTPGGLCGSELVGLPCVHAMAHSHADAPQGTEGLQLARGRTGAAATRHRNPGRRLLLSSTETPAAPLRGWAKGDGALENQECKSTEVKLSTVSYPPMGVSANAIPVAPENPASTDSSPLYGVQVSETVVLFPLFMALRAFLTYRTAPVPCGRRWPHASASVWGALGLPVTKTIPRAPSASFDSPTPPLMNVILAKALLFANNRNLFHELNKINSSTRIPDIL